MLHNNELRGLDVQLIVYWYTVLYMSRISPLRTEYT